MSQWGVKSRVGVIGTVIIAKVVIVVIHFREVGKMNRICYHTLVTLSSIHNISTTTFNEALWTDNDNGIRNGATTTRNSVGKTEIHFVNTWCSKGMRACPCSSDITWNVWKFVLE